MPRRAQLQRPLGQWPRCPRWVWEALSAPGLWICLLLVDGHPHAPHLQNQRAFLKRETVGRMLKTLKSLVQYFCFLKSTPETLPEMISEMFVRGYFHRRLCFAVSLKQPKCIAVHQRLRRQPWVRF